MTTPISASSSTRAGLGLLINTHAYVTRWRASMSAARCSMNMLPRAARSARMNIISVLTMIQRTPRGIYRPIHATRGAGPRDIIRCLRAYPLPEVKERMISRQPPTLPSPDFALISSAVIEKRFHDRKTSLFPLTSCVDISFSIQYVFDASFYRTIEHVLMQERARIISLSSI